MMGAGKSVVGRRLAERFETDFFDTDAVVERLAGRTIETLWADEGEAAFRRLESMCILRLTDVDAVVATGGGAILDPSNVDAMRASGPVVWLRASAETLLQRIGNGRRRPLLADADVGTRLEELLSTRELAYLGAASLIVDTDGLTTDAVADMIEAML